MAFVGLRTSKRDRVWTCLGFVFLAALSGCTDAYYYERKLAGMKREHRQKVVERLLEQGMRDFSECDLDLLRLQGRTLKDMDFTGAGFTLSDLSKSTIEACRFINAYLKYTNFDGVLFSECSFENADVLGASFVGARGIDLRQVLLARHWYLARWSKEDRHRLAELAREHEVPFPRAELARMIRIMRRELSINSWEEWDRSLFDFRP